MKRDGSADDRGARLLRLGSARADDATPSAGFEERLRTRLADRPRASAWNGGFQALVRPALALSGAAALLAAGLFLGAATGQPDDLASLVDNDPVFSSLPWDTATEWGRTP